MAQVFLTKNIKITVFTAYNAAQSDPAANLFDFIYTIHISNRSEEKVQLISRHWEITDALADQRTVDGAGVVGLQPIIEPGKDHSYSSHCLLPTGFGTMFGYYKFNMLRNNTDFLVEIPTFQFEVPFMLN